MFFLHFSSEHNPCFLEHATSSLAQTEEKV